MFGSICVRPASTTMCTYQPRDSGLQLLPWDTTANCLRHAAGRNQTADVPGALGSSLRCAVPTCSLRCRLSAQFWLGRTQTSFAAGLALVSGGWPRKRKSERLRTGAKLLQPEKEKERERAPIVPVKIPSCYLQLHVHTERGVATLSSYFALGHLQVCAHAKYHFYITRD